MAGACATRQSRDCLTDVLGWQEAEKSING